MRSLLPRLVLLATLSGAALLPAASPLAPTNPAWEPTIQAFEAKDKIAPPPRDGILFVGSSSIRFWESIATDFPGLPVYNRGFGGSQIVDSLFYADRIVIPYHPKTIVFYAGTNDIAAGKTPQIVFEDFKLFAEKVRKDLPDTKLIFISLAPNPARWKMVDKFKETNALVKDYIATQKNMVFLDVFPAMLGPDGQPLPDIYRDDHLHMNPKGYAIWTKLLAPLLN